MTKPKPKDDLLNFVGKGQAAQAAADAAVAAASPRAPARAKRKKLEPARAIELSENQKPGAVTVVPPMNLLTLIGQALLNPAVDTVKLRELVDWYDKREADNAFARDFLAMAKVLPEIKKDGTIDQGITKSGRQGVKAKYATYENIHEATSGILHEHGFTLSTRNELRGEQTVIVLRLEHYDVRFGSSARESVQPIIRDDGAGKTVVQAWGSGEQYQLRRMVIKLLNLRSRAPIDDDRDGNPPAQSGAAKAASAPLSKKQVDELQAAIVRCGVPLDRVKTWAKERGVEIEKIEQLPADLFAPALKACEKYEADHRG